MLNDKLSEAFKHNGIPGADSVASIAMAVVHEHIKSRRCEICHE